MRTLKETLLDHNYEVSGVTMLREQIYDALKKCRIRPEEIVDILRTSWKKTSSLQRYFEILKIPYATELAEYVYNIVVDSDVSDKNEDSSERRLAEKLAGSLIKPSDLEREVTDLIDGINFQLRPGQEYHVYCFPDPKCSLWYTSSRVLGFLTFVSEYKWLRPAQYGWMAIKKGATDEEVELLKDLIYGVKR